MLVKTCNLANKSWTFGSTLLKMPWWLYRKKRPLTQIHQLHKPRSQSHGSSGFCSYPISSVDMSGVKGRMIKNFMMCSVLQALLTILFGCLLHHRLATLSLSLQCWWLGPTVTYGWSKMAPWLKGQILHRLLFKV